MSPKTKSILLRGVSVLAALMMLVGVVLIAQPYYTDFLAHRSQRTLAKALDTPKAKHAYVQKDLPIASPVTRLEIPKLGVNTVVVEGTDKAELDAGAGHYVNSPLPGEKGNIAIAGHRTTYGKPFHDLDKLVQGDRVLLDTPVGPYVYEMVAPFDGHANPWVIQPSDWSVIAPTPEPMLTLTTCTPLHSARQRLVARLRLVSSPGQKSVPAQAAVKT